MYGILWKFSVQRWPTKCLKNTPLFIQKQSLEVFYKKRVLKNFAKFTGKHLCGSLFFNKIAGWRLNLNGNFSDHSFNEFMSDWC